MNHATDFGEQLLDWLNKYTFPTERKYADKAFAASVAKTFLAEQLKNGTTTSCIYCTVFPQSVDALFEEAERLNMRISAGKVLMNRNAPDYLLDTTNSGYDVGQCEIAEPVSCIVPSSSSVRWMPWPKTERGRHSLWWS